MGNKHNREFWESATMNNANYLHYYDRLTELACSMFEWQNLPDTIDARFLELVLYTDGQAVFFNDESLGYLALKNAMNGNFNVYGIPTKRRAYAINGYQKDLDDNNSVIIWNNYLHTNSVRAIKIFAKRLYDLDRIIDVNAKAQKTPVLITCDDTQRLTLKNAYMQFEGNEPVIFADKGLTPDTLKVLKTDAPYIADKIYQLKTQIWNEALTYLGISNLNVMKKERMVLDEVIRDTGGVVASRYSRLEARREAANQINKMFGLDISVDYRNDYREVDSDTALPNDTNPDQTAMVASKTDMEN